MFHPGTPNGVNQEVPKACFKIPRENPADFYYWITSVLFSHFHCLAIFCIKKKITYFKFFFIFTPEKQGKLIFRKDEWIFGSTCPAGQVCLKENFEPCRGHNICFRWEIRKLSLNTPCSAFLSDAPPSYLMLRLLVWCSAFLSDARPYLMLQLTSFLCYGQISNGALSGFEINSSKWQICHLKILFATNWKGRPVAESCCLEILLSKYLPRNRIQFSLKNYWTACKTKHNSIWSKALQMPLTICNFVWS